MSWTKYLLVALIPALLLGCMRADSFERPTLAAKLAYYRLSEPDTVLWLPSELNEISGIAVLDSTTLLAVQDELGQVFRIDLAAGNVASMPAFTDKGDFEALAIRKQQIWVLKSNGDLFRMPLNYSSPNDAVRVKTPFTGINDCEGMCWWPNEDRLLIACKGSPGTLENRVEQGKAIYTLDPDELRVDEMPRLLIPMEMPNRQLTERQAKKLRNFAPSDLAVEPKTNYLYVLSHKSQCLMVFSPEMEPLALVSLPNRYFAQPEGICFLPDGRLVISNERKGKTNASLVVFAPHTLKEGGEAPETALPE